MYLLVFNSGSSSIKYRLFHGDELADVAHGSIERIGGRQGRFRQSWTQADGSEVSEEGEAAVADHGAGLRLVFDQLESAGAGGVEPDAIAHRVVHGGERYKGAVVVDSAVLEDLRQLIPLAPLHNPANIQGIEMAAALRPDLPQVAVFDTAFHQSMPAEAFLYAVPRRWYEEHQVRRYGFHGSSHKFVTGRAAAALGKSVAETNLIVLHLGNGASATAIREGRSVDTSMGMTPLEGLVMGTRSGDLDPSILFYMRDHGDAKLPELERAINRDSGLKGLSGSSDMRDVLANAAEGDDWAQKAVDVYCYRIRKYIGAYSAVLGRVDALVFTGGVGENSAEIRQRCCAGLEHVGVSIDSHRNAAVTGEVAEIQHDSAATRVLVVSTNEELQIAREALTALRT